MMAGNKAETCGKNWNIFQRLSCEIWNLCYFLLVQFHKAPIQTDPGAHPASYTMGTESFPGAKWLGRGVDHPPHLAPKLKKK
jgi:hypothetical protein